MMEFLFKTPKYSFSTKIFFRRKTRDRSAELLCKALRTFFLVYSSFHTAEATLSDSHVICFAFSHTINHVFKSGNVWSIYIIIQHTLFKMSNMSHLTDHR